MVTRVQFGGNNETRCSETDDAGKNFANEKEVIGEKTKESQFKVQGMKVYARPFKAHLSKNTDGGGACG